ncbi:hypothetical protein FJ366_01185 [Candidatus Dependentiae bacterium]|nr:hypothetical protein [Candidatus Dependentiae bacterium]
MSTCFAASAKSAAIFDATLDDISSVKRSSEFLEKLGWSISHYSLFGGKENGPKAFMAGNYSLTVFVLPHEFFMAKKSHVVANMLLDAICYAASIPGGATIFCLPALPQNKDESFWAAFFTDLFVGAGLEEFSSGWKSGGGFLGKMAQDFLSFFRGNALSDESWYHTMLRLPTRNSVASNGVFSIKKQNYSLISLPIMNDARNQRLSAVENILPLGVWLFDEKKDRSFGFVRGEVLFAGDLKESFLKYPLERSIQKTFDLALSSFWLDVDLLVDLRGEHDAEKIARGIEKNNKSTLKFDEKVVSEKKCKVKTAWMEIVAFEESEDLTYLDLQIKRQSQQEITDSLLLSGINRLWISLSPQMIYGKHAKNPEKKEVVEARVQRFITSLKRRSAELGKKIPKIFIGFEIANNLYADHLPAQYAIDVFGNVFYDVPSPVSLNFWREEVCEPLHSFMAFYRKQKLDKEIALSGIVIDLELYGRKNASEFSPFMLCDDEFLRPYALSKKIQYASGHECLKKIMHAHLFPDFVGYAKKRTKECGELILKAVKDVGLSDGIMCYLPSLSVNWFTSSLCRELSNGQPFHLFTFASAFDKSRAVVEKAFNSKIIHSSVVMLSKITGDTYPWFFNEILAGNDGCWFNRWSRLGEPADKTAWHFVEQPQLFGSLERRTFYDFLARQ